MSTMGDSKRGKGAVDGRWAEGGVGEGESLDD